MMTIGYIGNGKSVNRYHIPYVLARSSKIRIKTIYRRNISHDIWPYIPGVNYTSDLYELLSDPEINLICVCTSSDHYEYAKLVLQHGKNCLVEKPFTNTLAQAEELYAIAEANGLILEAYQNRRYDSDFLTVQKVLQDGRLGEIYEIERNMDYFRPEVPHNTHIFEPYASYLYAHGSHLLDQAISCFGVPGRTQFDVRQILGPGRMNDCFSLDLFYPDLKVILRGSYFRIQPRPSFVIYGQNGMFVKSTPDRQEADLKRFYFPGNPNFGTDQEADYGLLTWMKDGTLYKEHIPTEQGDYGLVYDHLYEAIIKHAPQCVTKTQVLAQMDILEKAISTIM